MFNFVKFDYFSDSVFRDKQVHNGQKTIPKFLSGFENFYYKKAAVVSNFCLIGKICHDFLVPTMIELGCRTFMPFQTSDLHRVDWYSGTWTRSGEPGPVLGNLFTIYKYIQNLQ